MSQESQKGSHKQDCEKQYRYSTYYSVFIMQEAFVHKATFHMRTVSLIVNPVAYDFYVHC